MVEEMNHAEKEESFEKRFNKLRLIHASANKAIEKLHDVLNEAVKENKKLMELNVECNRNLQQQQTIVAVSIQQQAEVRKNLENEIIKLRGERKDLRQLVADVHRDVVGTHAGGDGGHIGDGKLWNRIVAEQKAN